MRGFLVCATLRCMSAAESDVTKDIVDKRDRSHLFQKGNKLGGRPLGARSKFGQAFYETLLKTWNEHGERAMLETAKHEPATFVRVAASLMPRQVKAEINNMRTLVVELVGADQALTHQDEYSDDEVIEGELDEAVSIGYTKRS